MIPIWALSLPHRVVEDNVYEKLSHSKGSSSPGTYGNIELRLDTSALTDHPDPYPQVFSALNSALGSSWVCFHGYSHPWVRYSWVSTTNHHHHHHHHATPPFSPPPFTTIFTITPDEEVEEREKRNGRVGVKVRPFFHFQLIYLLQ